MGQEHTLYWAAGEGQGGSVWALIIPFALLVLFWFIAIRPTRKRQRDMNATQAQLTPGARVMTGAGLYGTVASVEDDTVVLEVAPSTYLRYARKAIVNIVDQTAEQSGEHHEDLAEPVTEPSSDGEPSENGLPGSSDGRAS